MLKLNAKLERKIKKREKEFEAQAKPANVIFKTFKKEIKDFIEGMMYNQKEKDRLVRKGEEFFWWFKLIIIFFAFKGFTYWLTGR